MVLLCVITYIPADSLALRTAHHWLARLHCQCHFHWLATFLKTAAINYFSSFESCVSIVVMKLEMLETNVYYSDTEMGSKQ